MKVQEILGKGQVDVQGAVQGHGVAVLTNGRGERQFTVFTTSIVYWITQADY